MDKELVNRLLELNREFYSRFATEFSDTRDPARLKLDPMAPYLRNGIKLLDTGCGNGRLAERIDREGYQLTYVGIDSAPELIEIARALRPRLHHLAAEFLCLDLTAPAWADALRQYAPFDLVLALAVCHHLPGHALRRTVLEQLRSLLSSGGALIMSNWQFSRDPRVGHKIIPWEQLGIDARRVEAGDAVIEWQRGGTGRRYVHEFSAGELEQLARQAGFEVRAQFPDPADANFWSVLVAPQC